MQDQRLLYKHRLQFNIFSLELRADDERIIAAITEWIDNGIARHHESENSKPRVNLVLQFFANADHPDFRDRIPEQPTATFEDIEFYYADNRTVLIIDEQTVIDVDCRNRIASAYISEEHVDSPWIIAHRIFYLPILEILRDVDAYYVHAGCVCRGRECVLLCGGSGHGKSTTTYALVKSGFAYMSDDAVFVRKDDNDLEIFSFPEKIKLDAKSCSFFPELSDHVVSKGKAEIALEDTGIESVCVSGKPRAFVLLEIGNSEKGKITAISKSEALLGLIRQSISMTSPDGIGKHLDILKQLCETARNYRLTLGKDMSEVPGLIEGILRRD